MASRRTAVTELKRQSPKGESSEVKATPRRVQDPEGVRRSILEIASAEFAANGLSGARVDEIAAKTSTSKRMIYYYFGDKEGLYRSVLEQAYARIRQIEATLNLSHLEPEDAIAALVGFTFDYQNANEDFIRLVMVENVHRGEHLASPT